MAKRLYDITYRDNKKPAYVEDMGVIFKMSGMVFQGKGHQLVLMFPDHEWQIVHVDVIEPTTEEWAEILRATDDPKYYSEVSKAWLRKSQRTISGSVQQKVWWRDNLKCMYCGKGMGDGAFLTVDHFVPLELGGANNETNYLTSCAPCNRAKGDMPPEQYCRENGLDYNFYTTYLEKVSNSFLASLREKRK